MFAGRLSWLCHGTTPSGWTTSLRKRIFRPWKPEPIAARSIDEITVSVTLEGVIGPGFMASTAVLPAGQSAAHDLACIIGEAHAVTIVIIRVVENLEIIVIGEPLFVLTRSLGFGPAPLGDRCTQGNREISEKREEPFG